MSSGEKVPLSSELDFQSLVTLPTLLLSEVPFASLDSCLVCASTFPSRGPSCHSSELTSFVIRVNKHLL